MSASAIKDGLLTLFGAASSYGNNVSTNYSVLETSPGSALVIGWTGLGDSPTALGNWGQGENMWTFFADIFLKDTGNASALMDKTFTAIDGLVATLESDQTIQGTATAITGLRATRPKDAALQIGGLTYLPVFVEIDVVEYT